MIRPLTGSAGRKGSGDVYPRAGIHNTHQSFCQSIVRGDVENCAARNWRERGLLSWSTGGVEYSNRSLSPADPGQRHSVSQHTPPAHFSFDPPGGRQREGSALLPALEDYIVRNAVACGGWDSQQIECFFERKRALTLLLRARRSRARLGNLKARKRCPWEDDHSELSFPPVKPFHIS